MDVVVTRKGEEWVVEVDGAVVTTHGSEAEALETAARLSGRAASAEGGEPGGSD